MKGFSTAELAALADGSLAPERRAELEAQIAESPELAAQLAEQQRALALIRSAGSEVAAPAALREAVASQQLPRRERAPRRFRILVPAGAVAVTALIALIAVLGPAATTSKQFAAALAPTGVVPAASGNATLTKTRSGWQIELDATGLPRLDNGRFYEGWLRNRAGVLVPIGTFNEGTDVTLWAGVSPKVFNAFTITRERTDGNQASSGQKVLVGTVDTGSG